MNVHRLSNQIKIILIKVQVNKLFEFIRILLFLLLVSVDSSDQCRWVFDHYSPSPWELSWANNVSQLQDKVCTVMTKKDQVQKSISILKYIIKSQKQLYQPNTISKEYDELLSKMYYRYECSDTSKSNRIVWQYIDPLVGLLRDPLTICNFTDIPSDLQLEGEYALQSKRLFLLGPSAPYRNFRPSKPSVAPWLYKPNSRKILFDIGSTYFTGLENGSSLSTFGMRWFYEYFNSVSLHFDRIVAFEVMKYPPEKYWDQIPEDILGVLTFINVGVDATSKFNPWNILKSIANVDDYVIIKLDIDRPQLEQNLISQILKDPKISSLIDEMFFEMHVTVKDMIPYWLYPPGQLKDSYSVFTKLRNLGIRMHSWP